MGSSNASGPVPAAGLAGAGQRGGSGHPAKWTPPRGRGDRRAPASPARGIPGASPRGAAKPRRGGCRPAGAALAGPPARTPSSEPIRPGRPRSRTLRVAPANRAHLRGLKPGRPGLAPLRSPLARAAAASLPGRLREGRGGAGPRMQITPAGRCPAYVDCPPGAGHGIQINLSCGLSALSSAAVMNNSARRSLGANQKAATAPRCLAQIELAAAPHPEPPPPRGEPDTEHRPRPGVASRENRLPCRVRPPPPGSVRPPAPRGAGT